MPVFDVAAVAARLEALAPLALAESWDNVGLLVGPSSREVRRLMTCLSITPATAAEAIARRADLVVSHHPLPFRPLPRITDATPTGRLVLDLVENRVAVYSAHTAFDSACRGINQRLAEMLELAEIVPLVARSAVEPGSGRQGVYRPPRALGQLVERVKQGLRVERLQMVGDPVRQAARVAVACGSGGDFLEAAVTQRCDVLVTGEARFHTALAAEAHGVALVLAGHFATERFAVEFLAEVLAAELPDIEVWASLRERDPLAWA